MQEIIFGSKKEEKQLKKFKEIFSITLTCGIKYMDMVIWILRPSFSS